MSTLSAKINEEFRALIPPTLYFFVALHMVVWVHELMLKGMGVAIGITLSVAVAALILGKAVLIADLLPLIDRFPAKPLIYNIAWKTAIYALIATLLHFLERLVEFWRETGEFVAAYQKMRTEIVWPHFWAIEILLVFLIALYCTARELVRVMGGEALRGMFFGSRKHGAPTR